MCKSFGYRRRSYSLSRYHIDLEVLVSRWSMETHTFITFWEEFTHQSRMSPSIASLFVWQVKCHGGRVGRRGWSKKDEVPGNCTGCLEVIEEVNLCVMITLSQIGKCNQLKTVWWKPFWHNDCSGTSSLVDWRMGLVNTSSHWSSGEFALALLYLATLYMKLDGCA